MRSLVITTHFGRNTHSSFAQRCFSVLYSNIRTSRVIYNTTSRLVNVPASVVRRASICCMSSFVVSYIRRILSIPSPLHSWAFLACALRKDKDDVMICDEGI